MLFCIRPDNWRIGIGTTDPATDLHLLRTGYAPTYRIEGKDGDGNWGFLEFVDYSDGYKWQYKGVVEGSIRKTQIYYWDGTSWNLQFSLEDTSTNILYTKHIRPFSDNAYDLGSPTLCWRTGYFKQAAVLKLYGTSGNAGGAANPQIEIREDGQSAYWVILKRGSSWGGQPDNFVISYYDGSSWHRYLNLFAGSDIFEVRGVLRPVNDNTWDLGSSSYRWANIYCVTLHQGDSVFANGWRITEAEKFGLGEGLILVSPDGKKYRFVLQEVA